MAKSDTAKQEIVTLKHLAETLATNHELSKKRSKPPADLSVNAKKARTVVRAFLF